MPFSHLQFPFPSRQKYQQATGQAVLPAGASPDLICSAKAIYKLADKLEIPELKARAFDHIVQSLTVETLPYEAFSAFSDQFREIRQVQLDLLLAHWVGAHASSPSLLRAGLRPSLLSACVL